MSRYARQYAAAAAAYDNASAYDDAEEARDEAIAERTDELFRERMADDTRVQDALQDMLGDDYDDFFAATLRRFFIAFDAAQTDAGMADAGYALFLDLKPGIERRIRDDASSDANHEQIVAENEAAEARDFARGVAA